jgi:pimeloyl-ACP methyl ester carboxylesterase
MKLLYRAAGDNLLHYWGFSYGTVLGSVFSDMFPDDVGRVVLDGTVDVPNYMYGNWSDNLLDTQNTYEKGLIGKCVEAGSKCALNEVASGKKDLKNVLEDLYSSLKEEPMLSTTTNTTFLDYTSFKDIVFESLYSPYKWPNTTDAMAKVLKGDASSFIKAYMDTGDGVERSPHAMVAIAGGDALMRREHYWGKEEYEVSILRYILLATPRSDPPPFAGTRR